MSQVPDAGVTDNGPHGGELVARHRLSTRLWHWTNVITLAVMLMSGLMILNAHPRLYWGEYGANFDHAWLVFGTDDAVPFPGWATIPAHYSPADARIWHFAFAVVLLGALALYLVWSLANGHLRRDLMPKLAELSPAHLWHDIMDHVRLKFPTGAAALSYNILQKLAYGGVLFGLLPLVIVTGMAMSPGLDAGLPWLTVVLGGRQSARSLHLPTCRRSSAPMARPMWRILPIAPNWGGALPAGG